MNRSFSRWACRAPLLATLVVAAHLLGGCAVITVAGAATSLAVGGAGLAADAAIGTVRLTGKAVGAAADLAIPDTED